jgi:translation initiation factor 3 subunit E
LKSLVSLAVACCGFSFSLLTLKIYPEEQILKARLEAASGTGLFEQIESLAEKLGVQLPSEHSARRNASREALDKLKNAAQPILAVLQNAELVERLQSEKKFTLSNLQEHNVNADTLEQLHSYARAVYESGNYASAAELLGAYRALAANAKAQTLWGKFAADILAHNNDAALDDFVALRDIIEASSAPAAEVLQQRTWLLHWGLFVAFAQAKARSAFIETAMHEKYLNAVQINAPHLLRYLIVAAVTGKRRRQAIKELARLAQQESYHYADAVTQLLESLFVAFDFDEARRQLALSAAVLQDDVFAGACKDEFYTTAQELVFESYCRVHQRIDISVIAEQLALERGAAERLLVSLIRNAKLDAKIDSSANTVVFGAQHSNVLQQIIDKTKGLSFRTSVLNSNLNKSLRS